MADRRTNLIWLDLEMTGLDPSKDKILEIATIVTDIQLNIIATGPDLVIKQSPEALNRMDEWVTNQHTKTGLVAKVHVSTLDEASAEQQTLEFLKEHVDAKVSPMCGNSICMDRRFLANYMPELETFFHYRHLDVSTLKILAKNWAPEIAKSFRKESMHRALEDIKDSINELKFYRQNLMAV